MYSSCRVTVTQTNYSLLLPEYQYVQRTTVILTISDVLQLWEALYDKNRYNYG